MGIAFPRKEKNERIKQLNQLILEKFENGGVDEFCKWARALHGDVIETMPEKVKTKLMAFTDSVTVAEDKVTGETSIIAFRATAIKDGSDGNRHFGPDKDKGFLLFELYFQIH